MKAKSSLLLCAIIASALSSARADDFHFPGSGTPSVRANDVFAAWNGRGPKVQEPGVKVIFFGRAEGCDPRVANGPVSGHGSRFAEALALTGVPLSDDPRMRWAPSANVDQCDASVRAEVADTFVHINADPAKGGIGMYTVAGNNRNGRHSFFGQYGQGGKAGSGANANIEGSFVTFRLDETAKQAVRPWSSAAGDAGRRMAEFSTVQTVARVSVGDPLRTGGRVVQSKQQLVLTFLNPACMAENAPGGVGCRFKYLFNTAVYRSGVTDWSRVGWFRSADVSLDPAQGGLPILHGPITPSGSSVMLRNTDVDLYTSLGEPSQHGLFENKAFRIQVSFEQFKNALRAVTARAIGKHVRQVTNEDVRSRFGHTWDDAAQWVLYNVAIGQEVSNSLPDTEAFIGGGVRKIYIGVARD